MRSLRRLFAVSVASLSAIFLLCSAGARAQSAAAPSVQPPALANTPAFAVYISPPFSTSRSAAPQQPQTFTPHPLLKTLYAQKLTILARSEHPCYALRTYGFTTPRDSASVPHLSSYTTCTPASKTHLKELVKTPSGNK